ncbi:MAG TPA: PhoPQ-activated protein PqaA family protein [Acidobacteriota bacterium]|nr:PhoPQ-activated protein PqaA family protein [Acidobacteriota bacterium]
MGQKCFLAALCLVFSLVSPGAAQTFVTGKNTVLIRNKAQSVYYLPAQGVSKHQKVLYFPGDGGWFGTGVTWAQMMASWGYDVYGVDTKQYLESFTSGSRTLSEADICGDYRLLAQAITSDSGERLTIVGWSQGAGMGLLGGAPAANKPYFNGVIAIGLPETSVLGWRWKDNLTYVTGKDPDEPTFSSLEYLPQLAPLPFLMVNSTHDEYITPAQTKTLFHSAAEPKMLRTIQANNHHFDGNTDGFYTALKDGLAWIAHLSTSTTGVQR